MIYNLFLTFLSPVNNTQKKVIVSPEMPMEYNNIVATNESALKYLLWSHWQEDSSFSINRIFALCSKGVREDHVTFNNQIMSSVAVFSKQIETFYTHMGHTQYEFKDAFVPIGCGEDIEDTQRVKESIIEVSRQIIDFMRTINRVNDSVHLYMDISGGPRNAAMILLVICRLLAYHGVIVSEVFYSGMKQGTPSEITIHRIRDIYNLFDIISGFEEFNLFGSAKKLGNYFHQQSQSNAAISGLLCAMNDFSEAIKLSSRGNFETSIAELNRSLSELNQRTNHNFDYQEFDDSLIEILREPIEASYDALLKNHRAEQTDELTYVKWCLQKGYLQQALTLFNEYIPLYTINHHIIELDEAKFIQFYSELQHDKEKAILKKAINRWNKNNEKKIDFDDFYTCVNTSAKFVNVKKDIRSLPMLAFNTINYCRGERIKQLRNKSKKVLAPTIKMHLINFMNLFYKRPTELDLTNNKQSLVSWHLLIEKEQNKLIKIIENILNKYSFSLFSSDVKDDKYTLIEFISFISSILNNPLSIVKFNDMLVPLRQHLIKYVFKDESIKKYITIDPVKSLIELTSNSLSNALVICQRLFDFLVTKFKAEHYTLLILYINENRESDINSYVDEVLKLVDTQSTSVTPYDVKGVLIPTIDKNRLVSILKFLYIYADIKKARNDSNHANKETLCRFTSSSELYQSMSDCLQLLRLLSQ